MRWNKKPQSVLSIERRTERHVVEEVGHREGRESKGEEERGAKTAFDMKPFIVGWGVK